MSEKYELGFNPIDSPKLNATFNEKPIENPQEIYDRLTVMGLHEDFKAPVAEMLAKINATAREIMERGPDMVAANNRINKHDLSAEAKASLKTMRAINDPEYLDSDVA